LRLPPPPAPSTSRALVVVALTVALALVYGLNARHGVALSDEYVYVVGARYFADTASLNARFYSANAILAQGYPHQDMHPPGYALVLGALMWLLPFGYWTAVTLNLAAYLGGALAVRSLGQSLGVGDTAATAAGILFLLLPGYLPYAYWALPEVLVGALMAAVAAVTSRAGSWRAGGAAGAVFGLAILVRESVVFGLPAILVLAADRKRVRAFSAGAVLMILCAYVPLARHRAEGGTNFWRPTTTDSAFAFDAVREGLAGSPLRGLGLLRGQVSANVSAFWHHFSATEKTMLAFYAAVVLLSLRGWRRRTALHRRYLLASAGGFLALAVTTVTLFAVPPWSGARYWMLFPPLVLPLVTDGGATVAGRWVLSVALAAGAVLDSAVLGIFNSYKASRQDRQQRLADYVDQHMGGAPLTRVILENGWLFGLRHYPVEVVTTPPPDFDSLRFLQRDLWFDYVAAAPGSALAGGLARTRRYQLVNGAEDEAPLVIYRRLW
jgi:hypothetical protein